VHSCFRNNMCFTVKQNLASSILAYQDTQRTATQHVLHTWLGHAIVLVVGPQFLTMKTQAQSQSIPCEVCGFFLSALVFPCHSSFYQCFILIHHQGTNITDLLEPKAPFHLFPFIITYILQCSYTLLD